MSVRALDIVAGTAEAAYVTDSKGDIVFWNQAAEKLLGYGKQQVLGKRCYEVLAGTDLFGNRFCDENCAPFNMARRRVAIHSFQLNLRNSRSEGCQADVTILPVPEPSSADFTLIHILRCLETQRGADAAGHAVTGSHTDCVHLSVRESAVLRLLADGTSTKSIADKLFISEDTVRSHVKHILRKLNAHSRVEALCLARNNNLI